MKLTAFLLLQQGNTGPLGREGIIGPTGRTVSLTQCFFMYLIFFLNSISRINKESTYLLKKKNMEIDMQFLFEGDF